MVSITGGVWREVKILGLVGSPRKGGNTDTIVGQVLAGARSEGAEVEKLYLDDLRIRPCRACFSCAETGRCVIEDDFQTLLRRMREADGIVLGSPVYCGTVTAQTKALIDRADSSQVVMETGPDGRVRFVSRWKGRRKGIIMVVCDYGPQGALHHTAWVMGLLFRDLGIEVVERVLARGLSGKGDAGKDGQLMQRAFQAGRTLAMQTRVDKRECEAIYERVHRE